MTTGIVYTAFGPKQLHQQAIFSILTLWRHIGGEKDRPSIVVYTDDPIIFKKHLNDIPIVYEMLSPEMLASFRGSTGFALRVKVCVVQEYFKNYDADLFFVDTDTFFLQSPLSLIQLISPQTTIFHAYEYTALEGNTHEGKVWLRFRKLIKNNEFEVWGTRRKLDMDSEMWNSGVLGISHAHHGLIPDVLSLTDQITVIDPLKNGEQFAFSYVFQHRTQLVPSEDVVYHYWPSDKKQLFNFYIRQFLRQHYNTSLTKKMEAAWAMVEKRSSLALPEQTLWQRIKLRGSLIIQVAKTGHL